MTSKEHERTKNSIKKIKAALAAEIAIGEPSTIDRIVAFWQ
jgi:hypothetical protein